MSTQVTSFAEAREELQAIFVGLRLAIPGTDAGANYLAQSIDEWVNKNHICSMGEVLLAYLGLTIATMLAVEQEAQRASN